MINYDWKLFDPDLWGYSFFKKRLFKYLPTAPLYWVIDLLLLDFFKAAQYTESAKKNNSLPHSTRLTVCYVHIVSIPTYDDPLTLHSLNETSPLHNCGNMLEMVKWYLSRKPSNDLVMDYAWKIHDSPIKNKIEWMELYLRIYH